MHYREEDKESMNRKKRGQKPELDLEGPNPNKPLFSESDRDPDVESGWKEYALEERKDSE